MPVEPKPTTNIPRLWSRRKILLIFLVAVIRPERFTLDQLHNEAEHTVADWQRGAAAEGAGSRPMPGQRSFVVIVTADGVVRYRRGATPCQVGNLTSPRGPARRRPGT